jgi:hypothetical protein
MAISLAANSFGASPLSAAESAKPPVAPVVEEFVGPFPSWQNAKTDFGAVGDGVADDTAALQKGLDGIGNKSHVLYLPAGTYRLTKTLTVIANGNFHLVGEDPATTILKWDGPEGPEETMLRLNGVHSAKFSRLTWHGGGKKVTAVYHRWENDHGGVGTNCEHADEAFIDLDIGIRAGKPHLMDAETTVLRCKFTRCAIAGVRIQSFNALDWFIWDSEFDDCTVGITNDPGAGHFHAYRNIFRRSKVADITLGNAGYFGIRHNLSLNSRRFFETRNNGGWAVNATLQDNTIIDPVDPLAIDIHNVGPVLLLDNTIRSRAGVKTGPVVRMNAGMVGNYVAIGNTFTVPMPIAAHDRLLETETRTIEAGKIAVSALPGAVWTPRKERKIFEVKPGSDADAIQALIEQTKAFQGRRPVLHFPVGTYPIAKTLTVPAGLDVQFVGDVGGEVTRLSWLGPADGVMIRLDGPTRTTFRDISLVSKGKGGTGILVTNADQREARISGDGIMLADCGTGLLVNGVAQTDLSFRTFFHQGNKLSVKVVGGPIIPGSTGTTRTCLFGGASSNNDYSYDVASGGRLLVTDTWYEGAPPTFLKMNGSGTFTMNGAEIASGRPGPNAAPTDPKFAGIALENFQGKASFINVCFGTRVIISGDGNGTNALLLGAHLGSNTDNLFPAPPANAKVALAYSTRYAAKNEGAPPCRNVSDIGACDLPWLLPMLSQLRTDTPRLLTALPPTVTDLRCYRLRVGGFTTGMQVEPK